MTMEMPVILFFVILIALLIIEVCLFVALIISQIRHELDNEDPEIEVEIWSTIKDYLKN
jgi:cell division protein FtsX